MADKPAVDLGALQKSHEEATRVLVKTRVERDRAQAAYEAAVKRHHESYAAFHAKLSRLLQRWR